MEQGLLHPRCSRGGVVGELDEAFAVAAVHIDAQDIDPFAVAVEFPRDEHSGGGDGCGEVGARGEEVWRAFLRADESEIAAHGDESVGFL